MAELTPPARYESNITPREQRNYFGAGTLGRRDDTGLSLAFIGGSGVTETDQKAYLQEARLILAEYPGTGETGSNPMFPQYRRNFIPEGGTLTEEYVNPRDKNSVTTGTGTGLGTAYTPTTASPGAGNGINPTVLRSVQSTATKVLIALKEDGPLENDNPAAPQHQNTSGDPTMGQIDNAGKVRRFQLGVGSGAGLASSGVGSVRAQFPRTP